MSWLWELKTCGANEDISDGGVYFKKLTLDSQVSGYIAAARREGHDVKGVVYDVVSKTGLRPTGKGAETPESYEARIIAQIAAEPERYYQRGIIVRTEAELEEHAADVWGISQNILAARNSGRWPRQVGGCFAFNRPCDYWETCANGAPIDGPLYKTEARYKHRLTVLSNSAMQSWRQCPRKCQYSNEMNRVPITTGFDARGFGAMMHMAIQDWHMRGDLEDTLKKLRFVDGASPHDVAHARALTRGYAARWADAKFKVIEVEREYIHALEYDGETSTSFVLGGRVDGIVEEVGQ